ncbi:MAG TPA: tetratricopeptide repeat protein [Sphingomicrobium sp.]|nr:tetratricopeptide repeat protein [Sphingomicrobium sp.]
MALIGANEPNDGPLLNPATLYKDSVDALMAKRYADAKALLANLLLVVPEDAETNFLAGVADSGLKDWVSARKHYEAAVRYNRKLIQAQQELAVTYARLGQFDKTEERLRELERQNAQCGGSCPDAAKLQAAISIVKKALG